MFKNLFAAKQVLTGLFAAAIVFIPGVALASYGPDRPTIEYTGPGTPGADHVVFNSFTNVPNVGDERQFFHGQVVGTGSYSDPVQADIGDEVLVRVYVHNNADSSLNESGEGVAVNTRVRVELPTVVSNDQQATAFISADNAQPQEIFDTINIVSDQAYRLDYIQGSANIRTNFIDQALSDDLVDGGVQIGHDSLDGTQNGCFEYAAYVTFRVKINAAPELTIDKTVRPEGGTPDDWTDELTDVSVGDIVEYKITVMNEGETAIGDIIVGDNLPPYLEYIQGSGTIYNAAYPSGTPAGDNVTSGGVILKDIYNPGSGAHVVFQARVTEITENCGVLTLTNVGLARTGSTTNIEDTANIVVDSEKSCETAEEEPTPVIVPEEELPNTGAGALTAILGTGASAAAIRSWIGSRNALKASLLQQ